MLHQIVRFSSVVPLIEELGPTEVLDVGSGSAGVAGWLRPAWRVTAVDRSFDQAVAPPAPYREGARLVPGDARKLPFEDGAFDVAVALDVLEHIPPADRDRVIAELVRVARRRVIVAGPAGPAAQASDNRLADGLRARGLDPPGWLAEHERHGLPAPGDVTDRLRPHGRLRVSGDENLRWHGWLMRFEARRPGFHASRAAAGLIAAGLAAGGPRGALSRASLRAVRGPGRGPHYRTVAVLDLG